MSIETMSAEDLEEYKTSLRLLSADELRAQLGDDEGENALIQSILDEGRAIETKGSKAPQDGEGGENPNSLAAQQNQAKKPENNDDDGEEEEGEEEEGDEKNEAAGKVKQDEQTGQDGDEKTGDDPQHDAELPKLDLSFLDAEHDKKLQDLDAKKADKFQELMDGVIDAKEYAKYEAQYMRDRDALRDEKADSAAWFTSVHQFKVDAMRTSGINYDADPEKAAAWDDWVKRLAAKPEHAGKEATWFLEQAHKKVMAEFDITAVAQKSGQKPGNSVASGKKVANTNGRAPNLSNIPPTLGGLPAAAEIDSSDGGEFAHLDKLSGMAYERALAALSPDQKARYEAM